MNHDRLYKNRQTRIRAGGSPAGRYRSGPLGDCGAVVQSRRSCSVRCSVIQPREADSPSS
eukprot:9467881-Pyramimonas_sp.AAC.2